MSVAFRVLAVLGMVYMVGIAYLMLAVQDNYMAGLGAALAVVILGGAVFTRLFALRRWAAVAISLFCVWTAVMGLQTDLWQWVGFWSVLAAAYGALLASAYRSVLRPGF